MPSVIYPRTARSSPPIPFSIWFFDAPQPAGNALKILHTVHPKKVHSVVLSIHDSRDVKGLACIRIYMYVAQVWSKRPIGGRLKTYPS